MSNLSELLPAGGAAKEFEAVASGTLANGQTVALNSDGTVEAIASDAISISQTVGAASVFQSANTILISVAYDSSIQRILVAYRDQGNSNYGTAVVGTVSGSTITFGTPAIFISAGVDSTSTTNVSGDGKFVIANKGSGNGRARVATVSGTSVSFGSEVTFVSANIDYAQVVYDSGNDKIVIMYTDGSSSDTSTYIVGTVSGTSISFGSAAGFSSTGTTYLAATYDSIQGKIVAVYGVSSFGKAQVGTVTGSTMSWGTAVTYEPDNKATVNAIAFDSTTGQVFVAYRDSSTVYGKVGTVSGTSISFGTRDSILTASTNIVQSVSYHAASQKMIFSCQTNSNDVEAVIITISGTSFTKSSTIGISNSSSDVSSAYDSVNAQVVLAYKTTSGGDTGSASTFTPAYSTTNVADFIGITQEAIADTATGLVTPQGGVNGTVAYDSGPGEITDWTAADFTNYQHSIAYDVNAQKLVIFYSSGLNSNSGYYVVGTVSGTSLSFGTPGLVSAVAVQWTDITYDANSQKVVAVYNNGSDADHGYAVVGTVSGTSVSWGTPVKFEVGAVYYNSVVYDSNSQKVVISYYDSGNSNYGTSIVGTVSGTSISFGTAVVFESASTSWVSSIFDSTSNKIIIGYRDVGNSNYGTAIVGTVSGTSISFGSPTVFEASATDVISLAYDANANKVVVAYRDTVNSNAGTSVVGTVSGTSISFGSPVVFQASGIANQLNDITAQYDPSTQTVLIGFRDTGDSNYGKTVVGTVSGTSISFTTPTTFNENTTVGVISAYDSNQQKMVIAFDQQGTTPDTKAFVYTPDTTLTPNTDYYVQDDGTLSTTVSSVPAGLALSTTSILLEG